MKYEHKDLMIDAIILLTIAGLLLLTIINLVK